MTPAPRRRVLLSALLLPGLLAALPTAMAAPPSSGDEPPALETRISEVTVFADRARVTRVGAIQLGASGRRVQIQNLPGWIDEESVRATLTPASAGRILDVSIERTFLAEASEEAVRQAEARVNEVSDELAALADEEAVLKAEVAQLEAVRAFSLEKLPRDMATRPVKVEDFGQTVAFISRSLRDNRKRLRELKTRARTLGPELAARRRALSELAARSQLEQRTVIIEAEGRGRASLVLTYLTPGAAWEPAGDLRASSSGGKAELVQTAVLVQSTGEDWQDAALTFSTQRPTETLQVPEVQALLLGEAGPSLGQVMGRMGESFERAQSSYWAQSEVANRDNAGFQALVTKQKAIQARSTANFESLARRGTTAHFEALSKRHVRADGKAIRIPISAGSFDVKPRLVAVPEVSLNVVRTAEIVNTGKQPILPGKVALFVDGAFVGHSEVPFVAPGETFSTYLGVDERVKLSRGIDRKRSRMERGKRKTELVVAFVLGAENLSDELLTIEISDRVPVAAIDSIEVDGVRMPKEATRDANGIVRWEVTLPPRTAQQWDIGYELVYPSDLLARARPAKSPAPARMLFDDIRNFEESL